MSILLACHLLGGLSFICWEVCPLFDRRFVLCWEVCPLSECPLSAVLQ